MCMYARSIGVCVRVVSKYIYIYLIKLDASLTNLALTNAMLYVLAILNISFYSHILDILFSSKLKYILINTTNMYFSQ